MPRLKTPRMQANQSSEKRPRSLIPAAYGSIPARIPAGKALIPAGIPVNIPGPFTHTCVLFAR